MNQTAAEATKRYKICWKTLKNLYERERHTNTYIYSI